MSTDESPLPASDRLSQRHLFKGQREFELHGDELQIHIDMPFLKKDFTVVLAILDPEPVIKGSTLAFVSAVNREPLVELFIDEPDKDTFDAFVEKIRQGVIAEDYGKPKVFSGKQVDTDRLQLTLDMLRRYIDADDIQPYLDALETLKANPQDSDSFRGMLDAFNDLGPMQGAVLSYAPYIVSLMSDD